jgi:hypothetical protein
MLEVGLGHHINEPDLILNRSKTVQKSAKRLDSVWGAWFFFNFYFKPALKDKSKNLDLDVFLVQHDMENMYMWVFKERPENALGKMQLRSYMNGHSRNGERPFPFSVEKGFVRSHRMQRKHYRGLANPQCLHGIDHVPSPNLVNLDEDDQKKWLELTGRDLNFAVPAEAREFCSWRNLPNTDFELDRPKQTKLLNGSGLNLSNKRRCSDDPFQDPPWMSEFSGVMRSSCGPVTAAKSIYEDEEGYLIILTMPLSDPERVRVHWWNNLTHGVVKVSAVSTACMPFVQRNERTFKLTDPLPEHCPPGEFKREIPLATRIPDDARLEAYFDSTGTVLEIKVPKHRVGPEEHEVPVCLRPPNEFVLS